MKNGRLPVTRLGEILKLVSRPESVDPERTYKILGAHWYAEGLYVKDILTGSQIRADKVYRVEQGDFVYNRLFAWKGSFAVATEANAGCYVSNEFPCFVVNPDKADAKFLWRYFSRVSAWDEALGLSTGGTPTSRNRLKEEKFLAMEIPLPPLPEQRRVVARIEELAAKINEAHNLRQNAADETTALLNATRRVFFTSCSEATVVLQDICSDIIDNLHSNPQYSDSGVPCIRSPDIGYGTLNLEGALRTDEDEYRHRTIRGEPQPGDVVLVREGGGTGKCALVLDGQRFSLGQRVMMLRLNREKVVPQFFLHQLLPRSFKKTKSHRSRKVPRLRI
jgi:type I restriction enzyme, S subunit